MYSRKIINSLISFYIISLILSPVSLSAADTDLSSEMKGITIKDGFFESPFPEAGSIQKISGTGKLLIVRRAVKEGFFGKEGDKVFENDALYTASDCRCRVVFKDHNVVMLAPDSHFEIDDFAASILQGTKKSLFSSAKGKVIVYALRLFSYKSSVLEFRTPTAVIGVRGTKFGTEIEKVSDANRSSGLDKMTAGLGPLLAQSGGSGGNFITRIYVLEGEVDVASAIDRRVTRLRQNEILETDMSGLGELRYDPDRTKMFADEVLAEGISPPSPNLPNNSEQRIHEQDFEQMERMEEIRQQRQIEPPESHIDDHSQHQY
ncbi:MAG: FecR domain-containing protein [Deltaproteobacteria bacterium]|nr:FecR domain-containing protein [Deltaproteobacteria bacterium]